MLQNKEPARIKQFPFKDKRMNLITNSEIIRRIGKNEPVVI